jgi:ribosome-associated protein
MRGDCTLAPGPEKRYPFGMNTDLRELARRAEALGDEALLSQCREEFYVAGGPGGQHRNKTATGVRLTHLATGARVTATERRSREQNRAAALERLRARLRLLSFVPKIRRPTRPTRRAAERRLAGKKRTAHIKSERRRPVNGD